MSLNAILLDADGVLWRGRDVIEAAPGFIRRAKAVGLRCLLVSNNAGPNREAYRDKCARLGLDLRPEDIFSVNHLAGPYVAAHHPRARTFVIGSEMLVSSMREHANVTGADDWLAQHGAGGRASTPDDLELLSEIDFDVVMVGIDVNLSYIKLALASVLVQRGALLLAANPDYSFPFAGEVVLPGNGSIVSLIAEVSGVEPHFLGKPSLHLLEQIERETGLSRADMVMIGDRPETDLEFGRNGGIFTYMVETGVTPRDQLPESGDDVMVLPTLDEVAQQLGI